ncbi:MAG: PaaI family thioesterase [Deltaproteobacteria bacterium]|nr:PaaI family thioesterase [Deltaproteobacteria bacterium]
MSVSRTIGRQVPFADLLGVEVEHSQPGLARLALAVRPELCNSFGAAHGGVITTLADVALALAAITQDRTAHGAQTVDLTISFIGPGKGRLVAEGRCLRAGVSLTFCEGEVRDAEGGLVAKALGTFRVRRGPSGDAVAPAKR